MSKGEFYSYFMPSEKPDYVMLRVANIYGFMESGKTVLSRKIGARIEEECEKRKWGFLFIEGRRQQDVLSYIEEHRDEVKGLDYVMMLYDDAGRFFMSRESTTKERREVIKDYMEIRHIFENFGFTRGVIGILFNVQFYRLLDKTMRNSPMSIWKSIVIMDMEDRKEFVRRVGWRYYYFIKIITKAMFIDNYRLKKSDIKTKSSNKREEIFNWLVKFFSEYGINPLEKIDSQFVKRFALVELFDDKFIVDTGNDISKPKNYVYVPPSQSGNDLFTYRDQQEKYRMVAMALLGYEVGSQGLVTSYNEFYRILSVLGFGIWRNKYFEIKDEVLSKLEEVREKVSLRISVPGSLKVGNNGENEESEIMEDADEEEVLGVWRPDSVL